MEIGWFTAITLIITFCIIDMFDTIGTLVGTASRAGMVDQNGDMPNMKEALLSDAIGTIPGAMVGALIMGVLNQGLSIMGVDAAWVKTIKGLVVIAAVAYDLLSKKKKG